MINILVIDLQPVVMCEFKTFLSDFDFLNVVFAADYIDKAFK
jgi:hypothetical protein